MQQRKLKDAEGDNKLLKERLAETAKRVMRGQEVPLDFLLDGVIIPDHTPSVRCAAPWHAGMAYAVGYLRAAMQAID